MLTNLKLTQFTKVKPLTHDVPLACAVDAVLDGICPGNVWVNNPQTPTSALIETPEGHYLAGDPLDEGFNRSLIEFISATLKPGGRGEHWWWFYLRCPTLAWAKAMRTILPTAHTVEKPREFYLCDAITFDWRDKTPVGFQLVQVTADLLARDDLTHIERIRNHAEGNFGSISDFLTHGFAFCVTHDNMIVSQCFADNSSGKRCEVGVHTAEPFRQQGLATLTVAATVDWALSNGFQQVGWHCLRFNVGSSATACKVGFRKVTDYSAFKFCTKVADASALKGNLCLLDHDYAAAAKWYADAFQIVSREGTSVSNLLARSENRERYLLQMASAQALSGATHIGANSLDQAMGSYQQGGF